MGQITRWRRIGDLPCGWSRANRLSGSRKKGGILDSGESRSKFIDQPRMVFPSAKNRFRGRERPSSARYVRGRERSSRDFDYSVFDQGDGRWRGSARTGSSPRGTCSRTLEKGGATMWHRGKRSISTLPNERFPLSRNCSLPSFWFRDLPLSRRTWNGFLFSKNSP